VKKSVSSIFGAAADPTALALSPKINPTPILTQNKENHLRECHKANRAGRRCATEPDVMPFQSNLHPTSNRRREHKSSNLVAVQRHVRAG
jgi:hypothetical protein